MSVRVHIAQSLPREVRIDLRHRETRVPKHFLHSPEICSTLQQMRRKGMAQHMWGHRPGDPGPPRVAADELPASLPGQGPAEAADEQGLRGTGANEPRPDLRQVDPQRRPAWVPTGPARSLLPL